MGDSLEKYRSKRDFDKTDEPAGTGGKKSSGKKKIFAVQLHAASRLHYDFRLEYGGALLSWAVPKGPSYDPKDKRLAVMVEDHPIDYAAFEGTIPKGQYGGGTVMLWDFGFYEEQLDFKTGLKEGSLKFVLHGKRLKGKWALVRMKEEDGGEDKNWLLIKENDAYALEEAGISSFKTGIRSGRTMEEIGEGVQAKDAKNPMDSVEIELAKLVTSPPEGEWLYEIKYDGYRMTAFVEGGAVRLLTRNGLDYSQKFKAAADALARFSEGRACVLDGEMVVFDEKGKPDFQAIQRYIKSPEKKDLRYMIFDLLALDGQDLRKIPLAERKERLSAFLKAAPKILSYSKHIEGNGEKFFRAAQEQQLEGIVGKRADSLYKGGRNGDWVKLKCYRRQEFVIGGYSVSDKSIGGISSLLLGVYEDGELVFIGRAGTGFTTKSGKELSNRLKENRIKKTPFENPPKISKAEEAYWVSPELVAEVQFAEITKEKLLRQASFKGLREDKDASEVVLETPKETAKQEESDKINMSAQKSENIENRPKKMSAQKTENENVETADHKNTKLPKGETVVSGVTISSPDRMVYKDKKVKKIDVAKYYEKIAPRMLPFVRDRILSVVRCHDGLGAACFFKKHRTDEPSGISIVPVVGSEGKEDDYFCLTSVRGLVAEAQAGTVEFHVWGSKVPEIDKPDVMVFDLDPDEGMELKQIREGALDLKGVLEALSVKPYLKTSGGKGYHIVAAFMPQTDWKPFHDFARNIARFMSKKWPDKYTDNIRKVNRKGKIFIDWVRNGRGATSVAPYSLRAREGACVSMPIAWEELDKVAPNGVDLFEALARLKKDDPWKDFFDSASQLNFTKKKK